MKYGIASGKMIKVEQVYLDQNNPRHEPFEDQDETIAYLCREEKIIEIAKDIVKHGLNPLELFALIPEGANSFFSAEGNRRLCAIKLLNDPDLAPANLRNEFIKASDEWEPIKELFSVVFKNRDEVKLWLDRIHAGFNDGRGRRQWQSEQKARNSGYTKNDFAQAVLDLGESEGLITPEERKGRISTVQRYLGNSLMRDALGLDAKDGRNLTTSLSDHDFSIMFEKFMKDIATQKLTTRVDAAGIVDYSHKLRGMEGLTGKHEDRRDLTEKEDGDGEKGKTKKPKKPKKPTKIKPSDKLQEALKEIPSYKLEQLYFSLCSLPLSTHTLFLTIGAWSFLETLTAVCGRTDKTDFHSFLSAEKMTQLSLGTKKETKSLRDVVKRISDAGNSTKHNKTAAFFNGEQLFNDFETMEKLFIQLAEDAKGKT